MDIIMAIAVFAYYGSDHKLLPVGSSHIRHAVVGLLIFLTVYGVFSFLVALITLSQVGRLYLAKLTAQTKPV